MQKEKDYELILNGTPTTVEKDTFTYAEIAALAFPELTTDPVAEFAITFEKAQSKPREGTLSEGDTIEIKKNGTIIDVTVTNRS